MKQIYQALRTVQLLMFVVSAILFVSGLWGVVALAQDVPAAGSQPATWVDALQAVMKAVFPSVLAFLSAYFTKGITYLLSLTPAPWLGMVSSAVGSLGAAMTAAAEGLSVEAVQANAVVGAGAGGLGHAVLQSKPIQVEPVKSGG